MNATVEHAYIGPRNFRRAAFDAADTPALFANRQKFGIDLPENMLRRAMAAAMDATPTPSVTSGSMSTPVQFLQNWLPGFVNIITAARKVDELVGVMTAGAWEDEEIVQGVLEQLGTSVPYADYTNVPLSSWNLEFERRTVIRFEEGMRTGVLEEARASRVKVNSSDQKREAATLALEIQRNKVGFYGFNDGLGRTYGFLNDPNLPAAVAFPAGASTSTAWSTKTFLEITKDIRIMIVALRTQSQDTIDPETTPITLALPTTVVDYLSTVSDFGISVRDWLTKTYPRVRVVSAPELELAVAGDNVAYMYAETVNDAQSTDDSRTWVQVIPAKFRLIGVMQQAKGYEEDYSNATAGVMLKRPFAVVRRTGC